MKNVKIARVFVAVGQAEVFAENSHILPNFQIKRQDAKAGAVFAEDLTALEELALGDTTVLLTRLANHYSMVFEEVEQDDLAHAEILQTALHHAFFEVALEAEDLLVELDKSGLKLFGNILALSIEMVFENVLTVAFILFRLHSCVATHTLPESSASSIEWGWLTRKSVERNGDVLAITDLLKLDVGDFLVVFEGGRVVKRHKTGELGESRCHVDFLL